MVAAGKIEHEDLEKFDIWHSIPYHSTLQNPTPLTRFENSFEIKMLNILSSRIIQN